MFRRLQRRILKAPLLYLQAYACVRFSLLPLPPSHPSFPSLHPSLRPTWSIYSSSKHALNAITGCMRMEMKPFGINVVLVAPGFVSTNMSR